MSTSEFESMPSESEFDRFGLSKHGGEFPDDFSEEDFEFARELNALFSLDREEMPPLFVQTLLASEDPRLQPIETGFEKKTSARVFRRLRLKRQIFRSRRFSVCALLKSSPYISPSCSCCGCLSALYGFDHGDSKPFIRGGLDLPMVRWP